MKLMLSRSVVSKETRNLKIEHSVGDPRQRSTWRYTHKHIVPFHANFWIVDTELQVFTYCPAICMYLSLHLIPLALCFLGVISASNSDSSRVTKLSVATWETTIGTDLERNNSLIDFISSHESAYVYCMYTDSVSPYSDH
jgi:hypothetical protein